MAGIPQPKVLWLKNNRPLVESDHCKVISDGAVHTLEFTDTRKEDTGLYTARAMNVNGSTISTAELYIGEGRYNQIMVGWFMVFNATFNNISVISWHSKIFSQII